MIDTLITLLSERKETGGIYFLARKLTMGFSNPKIQDAYKTLRGEE